MDVRLDRRGVDPELAAARHLPRPGELHHAVVDRLDGLGPDGVGPADQRGVVGDALEVDAAELAQHQAVVDEVFGLLVAPGVEPHDDEHAEDHLDRGGGPASGACPGVASRQVVADAVEDLVIIEQPVELLEQGLEAEAELGDEGEEIGPIMAMFEHGHSLQKASKQGDFAPQTSATPLAPTNGWPARFVQRV